MKTFMQILLLLMFVFNLSYANSISEIRSENDNKTRNNVASDATLLNLVLANVLEKFVPSPLKFLFKSFVANLDTKTTLKSVACYVIPTSSYNKAISQQCREDSWLYAESLLNFTEWALKMFDATGKLPEGILSGNYHSDGHFDQCLKVNGPKDVSGPKFTGKYCTVFLKPKPVLASQPNRSLPKSDFKALPMMDALQYVDSELLESVSPSDLIGQLPNLAYCLPSSCSANDIESGLADIVARIGLPNINGLQIVPFASEDFCTVANANEDFDVPTIIAMVVFGVLALLLALGTGYDVYLRYNEDGEKEDLETRQRMLLHFSVLANGAKILKMNNSTDGNISCMHGIRALSCFWVVFCHTFSGGLSKPNANVAHVREDAVLWSFQGITNGTLSVDNFLFLSGLLVAYVTLRELDKSKGKLNVLLMYLSRYLRLTPVCAFLIAFLATLLVHLGSGPYWGEMTLQAEACRNSWWYYMLYINNFFYGNADVSGCMGQAWYLALDMQLCLVSPVFIYALWRKPKFGISLLGVALIGFTAITMFIIFSKNLPPTFLVTVAVDPKTLLNFYNEYYQIPWCRAMPYLVGIFVGYALHKTQSNKIALKSWLVATNWFAATSIALTVLFGMYRYVDGSKVTVIPQTVSVLYGSLHRTAWAVSLSWLVLACVHGYGGFVNKFLSWPVFVPISRLTYGTYLIHGEWINYYNARSRTVAYYTATDKIVEFYCNLVVSLGLAFMAAVCVEVPFSNLQKWLMNGYKRRLVESENELDCTSKRV